MITQIYRSYGKINLYLDVLNRRDDGFTDIETVFQSIDLFDRLHVQAAPSGITLTCSDPALSSGPDNLVYKAAALLQGRAQCARGATLHLEKKLPIAAGLAGGSGNAAATLIALNTLWDLGWSEDDLKALALDLGSDVPYCLTGGTMAATGRGELLEALPPLPATWLVLVHPSLAVTAGHAYGHPQLTRNQEAAQDGKTPAFRQALRHLAAGTLDEMIFNRMESGILVDHPELADIKVRLVEAGCGVSAMSGSGPTVFGLCADESTARIAGSAFPDYPTSVIHTVSTGVVRE